MRQLIAWVCYHVYLHVPARFALSMPGWFMTFCGDSWQPATPDKPEPIRTSKENSDDK